MGVGGECDGCGGGPGRVWAGILFCLSVECGLQGAPGGGSSDSHFGFAVGDEVGLWGRVVLGARPQGVAGARLGHAQLALAAVSLPPEGLLARVPGLVVGRGIVGQRVWGHLVGTSLLSVLLGGAVLRAEGPRLVLHSYGVQGEAPLRGQLGQVPALGVEVVIDLVGWTVGQVDGERRREQRRGERGGRERDS